MRNKRIAAVTGTLALAALVAGAVNFGATPRVAKAAQDNNRLSITVFRGELGESGIGLGPWGSGSAEASKDAVLVGTSSIKVTTQGMYQGARLDFRNGVNLEEAFRNPRAYLRFQVRFTGVGAVQTVQAGGGGAGADGPGAIGGGPIGGVESVKRLASPFKNMRYVLVMGDGTRYELVRPVEVPPTEDPDSYVPLAFPLSAITKKLNGKTLTGQGAVVKQLAIFGDKYEQFYIGEINVIADETDIVVSPLEDQIFFANQTTAFVGNAEAGATTLRYSWDFDAKDGIQEDASGRVVSKVFPKRGEGTSKYTVTLTVSDYDGIKKPQSVSQEIEVND
jgi:hypothetical protein